MLSRERGSFSKRTQHVTGGMRPPSFHARCGNQPPRRSALYAIMESVFANKGVYTLTPQ